MRGLIKIAGEIGFHLALDAGPIRDVLPLARLDGFAHHAAHLVHERGIFLHIHKAARDDLRLCNDAAVLIVHREDDDQHTIRGKMLAVAQNHAAHALGVRAVHQHTSGCDFAVFLGGFLRQLDHIAALRHDAVFRGDAHLLAKLRMAAEHTMLAVDGDEEFGLCERHHGFLLLLAGVAGNVNVRRAVIDDLRALPEQLIDDLGDSALVAGDGRGRDDHAVSRRDLHLPMLGKGHAVQRGHILAL